MAAAAAGVIGDDTVARGPGRGEAAGRLGILRAREGFAEAIPTGAAAEAGLEATEGFGVAPGDVALVLIGGAAGATRELVVLGTVDHWVPNVGSELVLAHVASSSDGLARFGWGGLLIGC
mmetsp:Transcript_95159/g.165300  ORF Transcript_95159/g.165300 Transcript_95159/m.165300 type:complete len:120 (-) Transcript_95159:662-1021(-)